MTRNAQQERAPGFPPEILLFDLDAEVGRYHVDGEIGRLVDEARLPGLSGNRTEKILHGRRAIVGAISQAYNTSISLYHEIHYYRVRVKQYKSEMNLIKYLREFVDRAEKEREHILPNLTDEQRSRFVRQPAADTARQLLDQLRPITESGKPLKPKASATDILARCVVWELRHLWKEWTAEKAPKSGGKDLVILAAAICRDTNTFSERDEDGSLEEWLQKRFMANWAEVTRPNLT